MTAGDCGSMAPGREDRFFDEIEPRRIAQLLIDADEPTGNDRLWPAIARYLVRAVEPADPAGIPAATRPGGRRLSRNNRSFLDT
jgi:hypothetical protein